MNLKTRIRDNLWLAIQSTYEAGNYSHAILDAMHYLSNVLRDKTGVDGDGSTLVGQALGGDSPRLRINKLQTETEKNEQKGLESILRGMYQAIRNPRSHEQISDNQETADAVINFVNYLLVIIEKSEEPFVLPKFLKKVFDPDFYRSGHYAELLTNDIPANKRFDTLIFIYRDKLQGEIYNVGLVIRTLIGKLSDDQIKNFLGIVSDELSTTSDEIEISYNLHLLPPNLWASVPELSRLRIENKVIRALKDGEALKDSPKKGMLATWAREHFQYFSLKEQVGKLFTEKLESSRMLHRHYVVLHFFKQLPIVILDSGLIQRCVKAISKRIREKDKFIINCLSENINELPETWTESFVDELKDVTDTEKPLVYLYDGRPFLSTTIIEEDDLPF